MPDPLQLLRDLYKTYADRSDTEIHRFNHRRGAPLPRHMVEVGDDLPPVVRAPMYRPQTQVLGGPEFANQVEDFFNKFPDMRGRAPKIQHGPSSDVFKILRASGFGDNDYSKVNLLGTTNSRTKNVTINPRLNPQTSFDFPSVLAHEMGHVVNIRDNQKELEDTESYARQIWPRVSPIEALVEALQKAGLDAKRR